MSTNKQTALVTGAAGFLGSHLVDASFQGIQVLGVDNFITGSKNLKLYFRTAICVYSGHAITSQIPIAKMNILMWCFIWLLQQILLDININ
jgi:nucleoside-diphosphate-sugar epimerase